MAKVVLINLRDFSHNEIDINLENSKIKTSFVTVINFLFRGKLSVIRCYTLFLSMAENRF